MAFGSSVGVVRAWRAAQSAHALAPRTHFSSVSRVAAAAAGAGRADAGRTARGERGSERGGGRGGERGGERGGGRRRLPRRPLAPYREWLRGDGQQYRYPPPGRGPHWIGDTPFPLNPAFQPPPPISADTRADMWRLHTADPKQWTVRSLSGKFRVGLERTEAILRLKALEQEMAAEGKPLQTEFQRHMERLLGSRASYTTEPPATPAVPPHAPRGAPYEEFPEDTDTSKVPSALAKAILAVNETHEAEMARLPTSGPRGSTAHSTHLPPPVPGRAPLRVVQVGAGSYQGVGTVARNRKRAEYRAKQKWVRRVKARAAEGG
ncbi:hypothetical protein MSPP1_001404 [Malassezia sp. CBS 17886]|nr:hypothetical protein MSPP1_001404 [Malassezia sp. CBS 17886]